MNLIISIIKGKVVDNTIQLLGRHLYLYNTLREDGQNVCITKMRPMPSLTRKPM